MALQMRPYMVYPEAIYGLIRTVSTFRAQASYFDYKFVEDTSWQETLRVATATSIFDFAHSMQVSRQSSWSKHSAEVTRYGTYQQVERAPGFMDKAIERNIDHYTRQFVDAFLGGTDAYLRWLIMTAGAQGLYLRLLHDKMAAHNAANSEVMEIITKAHRRTQIAQKGAVVATTILLPWAGLSAIPCTLAGVGFSLSADIAKFVKHPKDANCLVMAEDPLKFAGKKVPGVVRDYAANVAQDTAGDAVTAMYKPIVEQQSKALGEALRASATSEGGKSLQKAVNAQIANRTVGGSFSFMGRQTRGVVSQALAKSSQGGANSAAKITEQQAKTIAVKASNLAVSQTGKAILTGAVNTGASLFGLYCVWGEAKELVANVQKEYAYQTGGS